MGAAQRMVGLGEVEIGLPAVVYRGTCEVFQHRNLVIQGIRPAFFVDEQVGQRFGAGGV